MAWILVFLFSVAAVWGVQTPEEALKRLQEGNRRFVKETLLHPDRTRERRLTIAQGQSPYAVIVTCSDSRVVPEVIFDEGLGDLFVIRVAGNVVGPTELESIEYAVDYLHPVIVVVMGHENCGAVEAVVKGKGRVIPAIASIIQPSVEKAKNLHSRDLLKSSIELNALRMRSHILNSDAMDRKTMPIAVHGAYYNLQTGVVEFLNPKMH